MNLFEFVGKFSTSDFDKFHENYKMISQNIEKFINSLPQIIEGFQKLPERVQTAAHQWANYDWVPSLPDDSAIDLLNAIHVPKTKEQADELMLSKLDEPKMKLLFDTLHEKVKNHQNNLVTLDNAISCFQNEIYTGCALSLFALIDSCFLVGQPSKALKRHGKKELHRKLPENAIKDVADPNKTNIIFIGQIGADIIKNLYKGANNFDLSIEKGLKRDFLSHGMNQYNPNKTDCIKLFVLLYNAYLLFDSGIYHWAETQT